MNFLMNSFEQLNFDTILNQVKVHTPYGKSLKKKLESYKTCDVDILKEELDLLERFVRTLSHQKTCFNTLRDEFKLIKDLTETFKRVENQIVLTEVELFEVKNFLKQLNQMRALIKKINIELPDNLYFKSLNTQPSEIPLNNVKTTKAHSSLII